MTGEGSTSAERVAAALAALGLDARVREMDGSTRTATDAAAALGCDVAQIVKSLVFRDRESGEPVLALVSGANRVDEDKLARAAGGPVEKADANYVRAHSGFAIGGVAPIGHPRPLRTIVDADLMALPQLWAAAGTPRTLFPLTPAELERATGAAVADLKA